MKKAVFSLLSIMICFGSMFLTSGCAKSKSPEVQSLESQIDAMGEINIENMEKVESAESAYNALGIDDQKLVSNQNKLVDARTKLNKELEADINLKLADVAGYALLKMAYIQDAWNWNINFDYLGLQNRYSDIIEFNRQILKEYLDYYSNDKYITSESIHTAAGLADTDRDNVYLGAALGNPDSPSRCIEFTMKAYDSKCNVVKIASSLKDAEKELKCIESTSENYKDLYEYYQFVNELMRNCDYPSGESYVSYSSKVKEYKETWEKFIDTMKYKLG